MKRIPLKKKIIECLSYPKGAIRVKKSPEIIAIDIAMLIANNYRRRVKASKLLTTKAQLEKDIIRLKEILRFFLIK